MTASTTQTSSASAGKSSLERLVEQAVKHGIWREPERLHVCVPHAKEWLRALMDRCTGSQTVWHREYDEVADWLTDNHGMGLMLVGQPGLGKSLLCERIIPTILFGFKHLIVTCVRAADLADKWNEISRIRCLCVDDVGTEPPETMTYGTRRRRFAELCDLMERDGRSLLVTTNLSSSEMVELYGARTLDRLRHNLRFVCIRSGSNDVLKASHRRQGI